MPSFSLTRDDVCLLHHHHRSGHSAREAEEDNHLIATKYNGFCEKMLYQTPYRRDDLWRPRLGYENARSPFVNFGF